jgi:hypothetical protein
MVPRLEFTTSNKQATDLLTARFKVHWIPNSSSLPTPGYIFIHDTLRAFTRTVVELLFSCLCFVDGLFQALLQASHSGLILPAPAARNEKLNAFKQRLIAVANSCSVIDDAAFKGLQGFTASKGP